MKKPQVVATPGASEGNVKTNEESNVMSKNSTAAANVIPFDFGKKQVRAMLIGDQPWFVATDVCESLAIVNTARAMSRLDDDEKGIHSVNTLGGTQNVSILNESGLYSLILTSRKAEAKRFKKWVTAEVLPAIRKHGRYEDAKGTMTTLVGDVIGSTGEIVLDRVIDQKGYRIDPALQRSFKHTMKSRLRTRFNVQKTSLIPADQLADACNFVAAYALDGEFLPRQEESGIKLTDSQAITLNLLVHHIAWVAHYWNAGIGQAAQSMDSPMFPGLHGHLKDCELHRSALDSSLIPKVRALLAGKLPAGSSLGLRPVSVGAAA